MTDWEILQIKETSNKDLVLSALDNILSVANFKTDLDYVFKCLKASQNIFKIIENSDTDKIIFFSLEQYDDFESYQAANADGEELEGPSPGELIAKLTAIYSNPKLRFNLLAWKSAVANIINQDEVDLSSYQLPIIDFVANHLYLKSDALWTLYASFELFDVFKSPAWEEQLKNNSRYPFTQSLLSRGNLEFDIFINSINLNEHSLEMIDFLFVRMSQSLDFSRNNQLPQAYNCLADIRPDVSPLALVQRKLNVLHWAMKSENAEEVKTNIFPQELTNAQAKYPRDPHLLFLKASYIFNYGEEHKVGPLLIDILRAGPHNLKVFSLLAKHYSNNDLHQAAYDIFKNISTSEPLNLEFSAYAAKSTKNVIDKKLSEDFSNKNFEFYHDLINDLIELNLFEEIALIEKKLPNPEDHRTLLLYAKHLEAMHFGHDTGTYLQDALRLGKDPSTILKIKRNILLYINYSEWQLHADFVKECYEEFPNDDLVNYSMGEYLTAVEKNYESPMSYYEKALEINPHFINVYYARARNAQVLCQYQLAIDSMHIYISAVTHHAPAYHILGICYSFLGQYYPSYHYLVKATTLSGEGNVDAEIQRTLMASLYLIYEKGSEQDQSTFIKFIATEGLQVFDSLNKKDLFNSTRVGLDTYYWAAKTCNVLGRYKRGAEYCRKAVEVYSTTNTFFPYYLVDLKTELHYYNEEYLELIDFSLAWLSHPEVSKSNKIVGEVYIRIVNSYGSMNMPTKRHEYVLEVVNFNVSLEEADWEWLGAYILASLSTHVQENTLAEILELAAIYLQHFPEVSPGYVNLYALLGEGTFQKIDLKDVIAHYKKCLEYSALYPDESEYYVNEAKKFLAQHASEA